MELSTGPRTTALILVSDHPRPPVHTIGRRDAAAYMTLQIQLQILGYVRSFLQMLYPRMPLKFSLDLDRNIHRATKVTCHFKRIIHLFSFFPKQLSYPVLLLLESRYHQSNCTNAFRWKLITCLLWKFYFCSFFFFCKLTYFFCKFFCKFFFVN